jgi:hypothetical protein
MHRVVLAALATSLFAMTAHADSDTGVVRSADLQVFGQVGAVTGEFSGFHSGGTVLIRKEFLAAGATLDAGGGARAMRYGFAGVAGFSLRAESGLGVDLLGVLGVRHYSVGGSWIGGDDPGTNASLGFASARLRGVYLFNINKNKKRHFHVGLGVLVYGVRAGDQLRRVRNRPERAAQDAQHALRHRLQHRERAR